MASGITLVVTDGASRVAEECPSIQAAVDAAPPSGATIFLGPGEYREKIFIDKPGLRLVGSGRDRTLIRWDDAAGKPFAGGGLTGTFRSYTLYAGGEDFSVSDLTIANDAGRGPGIGQAIAAYVDARRARFSRCNFLGRQDTLFLGPLPPSPRIPGSFVGPGEFRPRIQGRHLFEDCLVEGDVDFIFGSGAALFLRCELRSLALPPGEAGYITAASTPEGSEHGFYFLDCELTGDAAQGTVFLGRPWRPFAQTVFLRCRLGGHIAPAGWSDWSDASDRASVRYAEGHNEGAGASPGSRSPWARVLDEAETEALAGSLACRFGAEAQG